MRKAEQKRETSETKIRAKINLDGNGYHSISFPGSIFTHMLEIFSKHSGIDIEIEANGDIEVDMHHTVEDTGIVLGEAFNKALGERRGIERYGYSMMPMDETRCDVCVDLGGRANLVYNLDYPRPDNSSEGFDYSLLRDFMKSFADRCRCTVHINTVYSPESAHHAAEAAFKGLARAFRQAVRITSRDLPSTKGLI